MNKVFLIQLNRFFLYLLLIPLFFWISGIEGGGIYPTIGALVGITLAGKQKSKNFKWVTLANLAVFIILRGAISAAEYTFLHSSFSDSENNLFFTVIWDDFYLLTAFYLLTYFVTYFYWRSEHGLTLEVLGFVTAFVVLMSGHRNYHVDAPKKISALIWQYPQIQKLGIQSFEIFLVVGIIFTLLLISYFTLSSKRPLFSTPPRVTSFGKTSWASSSILVLLTIFAFTYYGIYVSKNYGQELGKMSEGVGESAKEGESNLNFNGQVSKVKQPAALVRLDGDYQNNPQSPMLYFREEVLSQYNGREMVKASSIYDTDVPITRPGDPYETLSAEESLYRKPLTQSVFLITKHKNSFSIDLPIRMGQIKNPDTSRFLSAYRVNSLVPSLSKEELLDFEVGDANWTSEVWQHYLRAPGSMTPLGEVEMDMSKANLDQFGEDLRYKKMADTLSNKGQTSIEKINAIRQYLSKNTIYTLNPNHPSNPQNDEVAPYLFASQPDQLRGYCVHFAHAITYLLRSLGIPARIATGYLVDLSYAKDGHILVYLSDKHAWPEVYLKGLGWVPFDISPERQEGDNLSIPDEKLLNDLMSKLDPLSEIENEKKASNEDENDFVLPKIELLKILKYLALYIILYLFTLKLYLRNSFILFSDPKKRIFHASRAFGIRMSDLFKPRKFGETKTEFSMRIFEETGIDARDLSKLSNIAEFSKQKLDPTDKSHKNWLKTGNISHLKKIGSFINPLSLFKGE